jgi:hypothetical protein
MSSEAGKGSKQRPTDHEAFSEAFDRIFGKKQEPLEGAISSELVRLYRDKDGTIIHSEKAD